MTTGREDRQWTILTLLPLRRGLANRCAGCKSNSPRIGASLNLCFSIIIASGGTGGRGCGPRENS
jgi:hypothetical protein